MSLGAAVTSFLSQEEIKSKLADCEALIFDWDGVFNDGQKNEKGHNSFSEVDSMGINLMRYMIWKSTGKLPKCFIISGQQNETAKFFCNREHFHAFVPGMLYKKDALDYIASEYDFNPAKSVWFFDDILDLSINPSTALNVQIIHKGSPVTDEYLESKELVSIRSERTGGEQGIRLISEYFLKLTGVFNELVEDRLSFNESYTAYWNDRQGVETRFISKVEVQDFNSGK